MKKKPLFNLPILAISIFLFGCSSKDITFYKSGFSLVKAQQHNEQQYNETVQLQAPVSGIWTIKKQGIVETTATIKLNLDGSGFLCTSITSKTEPNNFVLKPLKYSENNYIISKNGFIFKVKKIDNLLLESDFFLSNKNGQSQVWTFKSDSDLKLASTSCREQLL